MRHAIPVFAAACLLALPAAPAVRAETSPNADICVSTDEAPYSPEQRIATCAALIGTPKDQPQAQAAALVSQEQRDFLAERNTSFGNPQYNLKHEMELRLAALRGMTAKALPQIPFG
jgi:hypothetical protein